MNTPTKMQGVVLAAVALAACLQARSVAAQVSVCPPDNPTNYTVLVPHESDCNKFYSCNWGTPILMSCPPTLHFNHALEVCDWPWRAACQGACRKLARSAGVSWSPSSCLSKLSKEGDRCSLKCSSGYELVGSSVVQCTGGKWNGSFGVGFIPSCKTPEDFGEEFVDKINQTLQGINASLLFILDESGSVSLQQFEMEKTFVKALVNAFPLSANRSAGVITFSNTASVDVTADQNSTCAFLTAVTAIKYSGGGTDIKLALDTAITEIGRVKGIHDRALVFLLTDGVSSTDPSSAASLLKQGNNTLFTIGVGGYDRVQLEPLSSTHTDGSKLFFGVSNFAVFDVVAKYLESAYSNSTTQCATV